MKCGRCARRQRRGRWSLPAFAVIASAIGRRIHEPGPCPANGRAELRPSDPAPVELLIKGHHEGSILDNLPNGIAAACLTPGGGSSGARATARSARTRLDRPPGTDGDRKHRPAAMTADGLAHAVRRRTRITVAVEQRRACGEVGAAGCRPRLCQTDIPSLRHCRRKLPAHARAGSHPGLAITPPRMTAFAGCPGMAAVRWSAPAGWAGRRVDS